MQLHWLKGYLGIFGKYIYSFIFDETYIRRSISLSYLSVNYEAGANSQLACIGGNWQRLLHKSKSACFYTLIFARIKQTRDDVVISELYGEREASFSRIAYNVNAQNT